MQPITHSLEPSELLKLRRLPVGAEVLPQGWVHFRVWAPKRQRVEVVFDGAGDPLALTAEEDGYFSGVCERCDGVRYRYRLDGEQVCPDPASRYQPEGPHGWSQVVDTRAFNWTDHDWRGIEAADVVLYELHIGTFTPQGTFAAAPDKLPALASLGITCIEMMPVSEVAGRWNWGYDGVGLFAPTRNYGTPQDLQRFIDRAHQLGIAVILDIVYNHIGPDGNYLSQFSDTFFSAKHKTDWGPGINFDGEGSAPVRQYFLANAQYWIDEFHFDGYRFDATQNIYDDSSPHILAEICLAARTVAAPRRLYLINENEPQQTCLVRPPGKGGYGMDALWNDDWHHSAFVALTGRHEAYYTDYDGTAQEFISAAKYGYLYQGQHYRWQKKRRGTPALDLPPSAFINYLQNHDQIANFGLGQRCHRIGSLAQMRAVTALMILSPQTPMLFQGQEWATTSDFNFFADHSPELNKEIRKGRIREMSQFASTADPEMIAALPDPTAPETFEASRLRWDEIDRPPHRQILQLHRDLIALRRSDPVLRRAQRKKTVDGAVLDVNVLVLRYFGEHDDDRLLVVNLGNDFELCIVPEPLMAPPFEKQWSTALSTERPLYGGSGVQPLESHDEPWRLAGENWRIPGHSATFLVPIPMQS
jgi:maltooligosyltrehalose trehalohydrolase